MKPKLRPKTDLALEACREAAPGGDHAMASKSHGVYLRLRDEIASGVHSEGAFLPGEPRLASDLGVSRVTVRRALERLAADGLVERRAGAGTRVARPPDSLSVRADVTTLMPLLEEIGRRSTARLLSFAYEVPPPAVSHRLGLEGDAEAQRAVRVRSLVDAPFSHLTTYVPADLARRYSEADLAATPLFRLLERGGVRIARADQSVSATLAAPDVAGALHVPVGAALIALTRVVFDAEGRGVEHLRALYRPDRYRFEMSLERVGEGDARHWSPVILPGGRQDVEEDAA